MFCKYCGQEVNNDDNFCMECGKKLNEVCPTCWRKNGQPYSCPGEECPYTNTASEKIINLEVVIPAKLYDKLFRN